MRTTRLLTLAGSMLALGACVAQPVGSGGGGIETQEIELRVMEKPTRLVVVSEENERCENRMKLGCIRIGEGKTGLVTFRLLEPGKWRLSAIEICDGKTKPKKCNLSAAGITDFTAVKSEVTRKPGKNGLIDLSGVGSSLEEFLFVDLNRTKAKYFYRIQACPVSGTDDCVWLDPPLENDGTGIN